MKDLRIVQEMGNLHLRLGVLCNSQWMKNFDLHTKRQTHAEKWIQLLNLAQDYWRDMIQLEIASITGTPVTLDTSTQHRVFGHCAHILVDIVLLRHIFDEVVVEMNGFAFKVEVFTKDFQIFSSIEITQVTTFQVIAGCI